MIKKTIKSIAVFLAVVVVPVLGNTAMLRSPHIWVLFALGFLTSIFQPEYHVVGNESKARDNGTELQIIWSVFITQLFTVIEAAYFRYPESVKWDLASTIALPIMVTGLIIRVWAVKTLGRYFTMHLAIQSDHKIIRTGPYSYFRHPSYVGAFLTFALTPVFLHSLYSLLACSVILPFAWIRRIYYEEKMLLEKFGVEYESYSKTVKRAIPGLW